MGTICILLGIIIFLCSIFAGFAVGGALAPFAVQYPNIVPSHIVTVAICAFIGLLLCLNLVMHGLTYNKLCKLERRRKH